MDLISVLRPISGVENSKFHPIVRQLKCPAQIKLSPRSENAIRTAMRKNNSTNIEQVLTNNAENIKRVSPTKPVAEKEVQATEPTKTRMNSMDLERQILNVTPPEFSNPKQQKTHFDVISQEMGVFDSQESQGNATDAAQERDYQLMVAQMLDNPKVDKKMMMQVFLNQMQLSGELPSSMN